MGLESVVGCIPISLVGGEVAEEHEVEVVKGGKGAHEQGSKVYRVRREVLADVGDLLLGGDRVWFHAQALALAQAQAQAQA